MEKLKQWLKCQPRTHQTLLRYLKVYAFFRTKIIYKPNYSSFVSYIYIYYVIRMPQTPRSVDVCVPTNQPFCFQS
ncbi:hypothetical protein VIGAN_01438400 [Vigna angularis var. angularis]|uniref:Uncharacterized protein n=1 Tax=Vigna angularis var. angularis TaxID=157739 RepID=A0A0S3R6X8_PHAAN|nr:hypothetical protein VIGAN_01438400 [Vigna angularis var. angularis]